MQFGNHSAGTGTVGDREGKQWKFRFDNGFGASVINDGYGKHEGLYELAVLDSEGHLTYETPVTDDVLGYLSPDEVGAALDQIASLDADKLASDARSERIAALREELAALEAEVTA